MIETESTIAQFDNEKENLKKRKIDKTSMTNMLNVAHWLGDKEKAFELYDDFFQKHENKGLQKFLWGSGIEPQLLSELLMGISWSKKNGKKTLEESRDATFKKYFDARTMELSEGYAADVAVLSESYNIPLDEVVDLIKKIKSDPRILATNASYWSTAISISSAIMAENMDQEKVIDTYVELHKLTKGKETEVVLSALLQASLLSSVEEVTKLYESLKSKKIVELRFLKIETISDVSKAFLVLAMIIGKKTIEDIEDISNMMKSLVKDKKLEQETATRLILADANKNTENPVLCRQGSFSSNSGAEVQVGFKILEPLSFPFIDYLPILGDPKQGLSLYAEDEKKTYSYSVALRLS